MKLLIDTQILLWTLMNSEKLTQNEKSTLSDPSNDIFFSSISLFEISLKYSIGKLSLNNLTPDQIPDLLKENGYSVKDVGIDTFSNIYRLPMDTHKDPFDRVLIWESIQNQLVLMTRDKLVKKYEKYGLKMYA